MALITESQAQIYIDKIVESNAWDTATTNERSAALEQASMAVERLNFKAYIDLTSLSESNAKDIDIIYGIAESALRFLEGIDINLELENLRVGNQTFGSVRTSYNEQPKPECFVHGIPSQVAWNFLRPHLRDGSIIQVRRVS